MPVRAGGRVPQTDLESGTKEGGTKEGGLNDCCGSRGLCNVSNCHGESCCMCWSVLFCNICATVQIWTRTTRQSYPTCIMVASILAALALFYYVGSMTSSTAVMILAGVAGIVVSIAAFILHMVARRASRKDKSDGSCCDDCAAAFFCAPCSLCQLFRRAGLVRLYTTPVDYFKETTAKPKSSGGGP